MSESKLVDIENYEFEDNEDQHFKNNYDGLPPLEKTCEEKFDQDVEDYIKLEPTIPRGGYVHLLPPGPFPNQMFIDSDDLSVLYPSLMLCDFEMLQTSQKRKIEDDSKEGNKKKIVS